MIEAGHQILQKGLPNAIQYGNRIYQESFAGTPSSELFYPIAGLVYSLGNTVFSNDEQEKQTSWTPVIAKVAIVAGALFYGKMKEKSAFLLLAEVGLAEGNIFVYKKLKKSWVAKEIDWFQYLLAIGITQVVSGVLQTYLSSKRNPTLPLKGYYFNTVALQILFFLKRLSFDQHIYRYLQERMGDAKCSDQKTPRVLIMNHMLSGIALGILVAKGATLVTGESLKIDWKVHILSQIAWGATKIYL